MTDKFKTKTVKAIDSDDFDELVMEAYGGNYEIIAEQELNNGSVVKFTVPSAAMFFGTDAEDIRTGKYPMYKIHHIVQCLFEDGFIDAGNYEIECDW